MENSSIPNGQRVTTPEGAGEVVDSIGYKVIVKLDSGKTGTYASDDVVDDSNAG